MLFLRLIQDMVGFELGRMICFVQKTCCLILQTVGAGHTHSVAKQIVFLTTIVLGYMTGLWYGVSGPFLGRFSVPHVRLSCLLTFVFRKEECYEGGFYHQSILLKLIEHGTHRADAAEGMAMLWVLFHSEQALQICEWTVAFGMKLGVKGFLVGSIPTSPSLGTGGYRRFLAG